MRQPSLFKLTISRQTSPANLSESLSKKSGGIFANKRQSHQLQINSAQHIMNEGSGQSLFGKKNSVAAGTGKNAGLKELDLFGMIQGQKIGR
jgi:hypothetical protein